MSHDLDLIQRNVLISIGNTTKSRLILSKGNECSQEYSMFEIVNKDLFQHIATKLCVSYHPLSASIVLQVCKRAVFKFGVQRAKGKGNQIQIIRHHAQFLAKFVPKKIVPYADFEQVILVFRPE